ILDGKTIIASPHKIYGPETNDLALQLRKANASQVIFARMAANLCIELRLVDPTRLLGSEFEPRRIQELMKRRRQHTLLAPSHGDRGILRPVPRKGDDSAARERVLHRRARNERASSAHLDKAPHGRDAGEFTDHPHAIGP